jgi:AcrR family transcriptional regulator
VQEASDVRPPTRQRVLDVSAELFNRYGIEAVSVGQISEALRISPGNLTYHYRKKSDLVEQQISLFERELRERVDQIPASADPKAVCDAYTELLRLTLRYRFLFIGANYIFQNDLVAVGRYKKLIDATKRSFVRQFRRLTEAGFMSEILEPYSVEMLVDSIWWQWLGWLLIMQIATPSRQVSERALLADAVLHIRFLSHHYVDQEMYRAVQLKLEKVAQSSREKPVRATTVGAQR